MFAIHSQRLFLTKSVKTTMASRRKLNELRKIAAPQAEERLKSLRSNGKPTASATTQQTHNKRQKTTASATAERQQSKNNATSTTTKRQPSKNNAASADKAKTANQRMAKHETVTPAKTKRTSAKKKTARQMGRAFLGAKNRSSTALHSSCRPIGKHSTAVLSEKSLQRVRHGGQEVAREQRSKASD